MKKTAVLITRLPEYPQIVLERLTLGFFDEILIETNSPSIYQRYLTAKKAKYETIYVQDDDCLVNYQVLFKSYNNTITNTMTLPFQKQYEPLGCTLVGWGCYFPKYMMNVFDRYTAKYGDSDQHLLREADRIFTFLNKPFNTIIMPHEDLFKDQNRMSTTNSGEIIQEHFTSRDEALRKCSLL